MKIGILETGNPPPRLAASYPSYGRMVARLLGDPDDVTVFAVSDGHLPRLDDGFDAFVITGSPAGVEDGLPWVDALIGFLRAVDGRAKLVGLCFGHQVMAAAFGGRVARSENGWGLGLHTYDVVAREAWMDGADTIAVPAIHQDQVIEPPPDAILLGGSAFTPYGVLAYRERKALSFQVHPEFDADYATALIEGHQPAIPHDEAFRARALASLKQPSDAKRVGAWIRRFLNHE